MPRPLLRWLIEVSAASIVGSIVLDIVRRWRLWRRWRRAQRDDADRE